MLKYDCDNCEEKNQEKRKKKLFNQNQKEKLVEFFELVINMHRVQALRNWYHTITLSFSLIVTIDGQLKI